MTEPVWPAQLELWATAYAAFVATIALGLEIHRRLTEGPKLDVSLIPDGQVIGGERGDDEDNLLIVDVVNRGTTSTTMENLLLFEYCERRWTRWRWRRRRKRSLVVLAPQPKGYPPNLPSQLDPNRRWRGFVRKGQLTFDLETGDYWVGIEASHAKQPILKHIPRKLKP